MAKRCEDCKYLEGVGVTARELAPGTIVMVAAGRIPAIVQGQPCLIAMAEVIGPASVSDTSAQVDADDMYWLRVHLGAPEPLPQMYRAREILGIPALGLTTPSLAARTS